jgi:hypothetical protein
VPVKNENIQKVYPAGAIVKRIEYIALSILSVIGPSDLTHTRQRGDGVLLSELCWSEICEICA